jgi:hypothetical protein
MSRVLRSSLVASVVAIFVVVLLTRATASLVGEGQTPVQAPAPADVAPFVGDWLVSMSMQAIEVSLAVSVTTDGVKPSAAISSDGQPTINVTDISVVGNRLVLKYMTQAMGTMLSTVLTLTPDGPALRANMAIMDGQYEMSGSGTKQALGTPIRATGFGGGGRGAATSPGHPTVRAHPRRKPPASSCPLVTAPSSSPPSPTSSARPSSSSTATAACT